MFDWWIARIRKSMDREYSTQMLDFVVQKKYGRLAYPFLIIFVIVNKLRIISMLF
jgi:hypothetical protein